MIRGIPLATIAVLALLILATGIVSAAPQQQTVVNICSRTPEVQSAILNRVPGATCSTVTDTQLAGITSLTISGHSNASFVSGDFAGLTNLGGLYLARNSLTTLEADLFEGLTNLENLSLSGNSLMTLDEGLFDGLTKLTSLNLSGNSLMTLDEGLFDDLTKLTSLHLADNSLMTLDEDPFDGLTSLNTLYLYDNDLMTLEVDLFDDLTNLTSLALSRNNLMTLEADLFAGLTTLETLSLSGNNLTTLEADLFDGLTNLGGLYLARNSLTTLEADLFEGLTSLYRLALSGNSLMTLEADLFDGLANLYSLNLNSNSLMTLEADLFAGLINLYSIDLRGNSFMTLDEDLFAGLINLNTIELDSNSLMTLEAGLFDGLINLEDLSLIENDLMTLEAGLFDGLTSLNTLDLGSNSLMTLEADLFDGLTSLNTLYLYDNDLMTLEVDLFDDLTSLTSLNLSDNDLMTLDADLFDSLTKLSFLGLVDNNLMTLDADLFDGPTSLYRLYLGYNNLMTLDADLFDSLTNLNELYLNSNSLMTLDEDLFDGLTGLRTLQLECNSLTALNLVLFDPVATTLSSLDISGNDFATPPTEMDIRAKITNLRFLTAGDNIRCKRVTVMFGAADYTVPEGDTVEVTVSLSADPERTVTIPLAATEQGGATSADYSVPTGVTFNAGGTEQTITFSATQDTVDDDDESVLLAFGTSLPSGVSVGTPNQVTFSITDDDDPQVTVMFGAADHTVPEGDTVEVTVSLSADPERTVTIPLAATEQDEAVPADYSVPTGVTFNAGDTEQTITFSATQDTVDDDGESVLLAFGTSLPSGVSAGTPNQVTFSITDDDDPQVTVMFGAADHTVPEGDTVEVTVSLSADPERTVTIPLAATEQGEAVPADYSVPTGVTFNAGDTEQTITFSATQDTVDDDDESVLLAFGTSLPSGVSVGTPNQVTFSITDDDDPQVTVMFGAADHTVPEGDTVEVTVSLSADPERTVTIPLAATEQDGATSADYSVPTGVTFNAGDTEQTITFSATQDTVDDDDESVLLAFGTSLPSGVSVGTPNQVTFSITDDDDPQVTVMFGAADHTVPEGDTVEVTVSLSADPERTVTIPLAATEQGEAVPADYSVPTGVTFNAGDTEQTITFSATQDTVDDDDESVLLAFGALPSGVSSGTPNQVTFSITDDDDPQVTVMFGAADHTVPEGDTVEVTVSLSADPERTVTIPLAATEQGEAVPADYSVPTGVTFNAGDTEQTITFSATQDTVDDDDESVLLAFGALPSGVSSGTPNQVTFSITDDDDPQVTVMFGAADHTVPEGDTVEVTVSLSADPERTVTIPITTTEQDGATSADYSGVPVAVTFNTGQTSKTFEFMATQDEVDDDDESVLLAFGTSLPSGVSAGTPATATVTIKQTQFVLDCSGTTAVWCADLGFSDRTAENWGWAYLRYGEGWDPPASLSDEDFRFRGVNYTVRTMELRPGTHPSMPNAWSRWQQGYSHFAIGIFWNQTWGAPSREHYQDWVLNLDGLELPFKDALRHGASFIWVGAEIQEVFNDWTPSTVNMIGIEEVAAADQDTNPLLPWAPMQVDAPPQGPNRLLVVWAKPAWYFTGLPAPTKYIVQWKLASASWDNSAYVSEREVAAGSNFHSLTIDGLTEDVLYSVRVIAGNDAGNGPPSEETLGRPQDDSPQLIAQTINGDRLTLRFSNRLSTGSVPAGTAFTVLADDGLIEVDSVAIRGNEVVLTLDRAVTAAAHSVKVRYDKPTGPTGVFLRDISDNHAHIRQHHELLEVVNITPDASVQPLTARFANEPANHNGRDNFTFDIEFSEPVWVAIGFPRDDMLEVTGGTVVSAPWRERRSDAITFHVRPDTMGDIVIVLPGNQVCEGIIEHTDWRIEPVAGAPCAIGNRKLTNSLTMTVPGPLSTAHQVVENTPAQGQPLIEGIPEPGQTLSANTNTITDADGLENAVFRYQWLADDAESTGATGATYTVESGDVGRAIRVRVTFTDDGGNEETLTSAPTVVTAAGLQLGSAGVDGATMKLTYNEELDTGVTLSTTAFAVEVNGSSLSLIGVGVGQSNVLLLLNPAVEAGDTVTVDYTAPDGPDFIRDTRGRKAASFSGQAVTNDTASVPLTATIHDVPLSHNGQDAFTFELRFSADPQPDFSYTTVRDHAFIVTGGSVTYVRRLEPGKNARWEITVTPGSGADVAIALNATTDCFAQGAICTEDGGMLSGGPLLAVPGPNTPSTGLPTIAGRDQVGETLTADTSGIEDEDGLNNAAFAYQWLADDAEINGATVSTYTLVDTDESKTIQVRVSFTDDGGNDETLTSAATDSVVAAAPPANTRATGLPTIAGRDQVGETLTADTSGIEDEDGLNNAAFAYQWLADDAEINGATVSTYTLVDTDESKTIQVRVSFTDDGGNDETLTSAATDSVVAAAPPANTRATGLPTIAGRDQVGETLTADTSGIEDEDGLNNAAFAYQWLADDAEINGATVSTYTLVDTDESKTIQVRVSFTDDGGNDETLTSAATDSVVAAAPPANTRATGLPTIAGRDQVGETLTADTSGIEDEDGLNNAAFAYQWLADDAEINGATASTHTLADADAGKTIQVRVSFTDDTGNDEILTSVATEAVLAAAPPANTPSTGLPTIAGRDQVGETLTADTTGVEDDDGLDAVSFNFQWLADDADIEGATGSSYTITEADEGLVIQVRVSFTDDAGNSETLTSEGTEAVASSEPENPVEPPPAPQNLVATVNSDGSVTLTWEAPDDDGITGYRILRRRPTEEEDTLLVYVADTESTATTYTDTNVTAGVQHAYRVMAINGAGAGPVSNFVNVTP